MGVEAVVQNVATFGLTGGIAVLGILKDHIVDTLDESTIAGNSMVAAVGVIAQVSIFQAAIATGGTSVVSYASTKAIDAHLRRNADCSRSAGTGSIGICQNVGIPR